MFRLFSPEKTFRSGHRTGLRQGIGITLLVASPLIVAGVKWMIDNQEPLKKQMQKTKEADWFIRVFNKDKHEERKVERRLNDMRRNEGNIGSFDVEAADDDTQSLSEMMKNIAMNETEKQKTPEEPTS